MESRNHSDSVLPQGDSWLQCLLLLVGVLILVSALLAVGAAEKDTELSMLPPAATTPTDFARDVQPLFAKHCVKCHGPEKQKSDLRLDVKDRAMRGGDSGRVILPGKSAASKLIHLVAGLEPDAVMPPNGERLTPLEVGLLRAWIEQGANWPEAMAPIRVRSEHWSLQPLPSLTVSEAAINKQAGRGQPKTTGSLNTDMLMADHFNPIDSFISARLATNGLTLSPLADRATLIRRLSFDLTGLPPSPREIDAFVADQSPRAYEQLVERLLASPRYGERWGRHWLDVARYTESQGFEYDRLRNNAWHYRDYVIKSFNDDKPYDRFMKEQIAGDVLEPVTSDTLIGVSLLVCGPWDQAGNAQANATQKAITREDELEDLIGVVGQSFLGLTINCARCHTHKFDPIPHEEYYRIKSVFEGVKHGEGSIASPSQSKARDESLATLAQEVAEAQREVTRIEAEGWKLAALKRPASTRKPGPASFHAAGFSIPESEVLASLSLEQSASRDAALARGSSSQKALDAVKSKTSPVSYLGTRVQPKSTMRLKRGDVNSPDEIVTPGALSAIVDLSSDFGLSADAPEAQRRLKFAAWVADPRHPLPARVMANRVWHYHFGQGLVATPNDFGVSGVRPTHPELLDWLAVKFIESGWSVKALHRLIVNSATYRQSSSETENSSSAISHQSGSTAKTTAAASQKTGSLVTDYFRRASSIDADNTLLWRFRPRRLEAEVLRDAMLAVSGQINFQMGGPSFRSFTVANFNSDFYEPKDLLGPEFNRRTVYRMNVNSGKEPLLDAFDCPDPSVKAPRRGVTTTPLQALGLMNNSFVQRQAGHFAARAMQESSNDLPRAIHAAYRLAFGRTPTTDETRPALAAAKERSLTNVCWALLNSTEFVYVR